MSPLRTPQSCTSLYTPFGVYAGSSSDAELLSKRGKCAIHCRAYGFSRSCTSLYTPVEKSAPSAPCARLRRKRQYNCVILCRLCARLSHVRLCTLLSAFTQAPRLTRNCFPNGANAQSIVGLTVFLGHVRLCTLPSKNPRPPRLARGCGANGRQFPRDTLSPFGVTMSATGVADAPCPPRAWSARSILQSKRRVVRYENRRRH